MNILIIKLGYSETFVNDSSKIVSLGDVLRTTPIAESLHKRYSDAKISWLVSKEAKPLIDGANLLTKVYEYGEKIEQYFDLIINLEKFDEIFNFIDSLKYNKILGFTRENLEPFRGDENLLWQEKMCHIIGLKWQKEPYLLGYTPRNYEKYDVGLNYLVGSKWPTKAMSFSKWQELANLLEKENISYSWQEGKENLIEYIEWLNSCKIVITQDSLGMHIAMALNKRYIALFGSTGTSDMYFYGKHKIIKQTTDCQIIPCYKPICQHSEFCMDKINLCDIIKSLKSLKDNDVFDTCSNL